MTRKGTSPLKEAGESVLFVRPEIGMIEEEEDSPVMEAVTGPLGLEMAEQGVAEERQVADKIQDFVADEFILEAEGSADDFLFIEDDGVIQASTESQSELPEPGGIL